MKNFKIFLFLASMTAGLLAGQEAQAQRGGAVNFQYFYNELSPYGNWTSHPRYGSVWTPFNVGRNFQPYGTDGRWVMTEFGNTWVSDFAWGWAAFHYGRWFFDDYLGWAWVPGYEWGPAWVDWRSDNNYYGWAPMWPGVRIGVSFNVPINYWVFIPRRHLFRRNVFGYCVPRNRYNSFFGRTTVINNYFYNDNRRYQYSYGPSRREVERVTRGNVPTYRADEVRNNRVVDNRGSSNSNRTYRADDYSRRGLTRESRDYGGSTNGRSATTSGRSSRSYDAGNNGSNGRSSYENSSPSSGRTYDATDSYNSRSRSSSDRSGRSYEGSSSPSTPSYDNSSRSRSSSPSVSSPSSNDSRSRSGAPATRSTPNVQSTPSRSRSNSSPSNSSYSSPSRSSAPAVRSQPSQSSSRSSAPAVRSQPSSRSSAPRSSSGSQSSRSSSSSSSSSSRSRGPR